MNKNKQKDNNRWLLGCLVVLIGTIPILAQLTFIFKILGLIVMFIGGVMTFIGLENE